MSERRRHILMGIAVLAVIGAYYAISRAVPDLDLEQVLEDISDALGAWTYLLVGAFAFLETGAFVGLVVPGETAMYLGGAVAGQGAISIYVLIAIGWFAAWAGDTTSFFIGRRLGRGFILAQGPRVGITRERFVRVERYFERHGGKTILIGRFVSLVRALAPFVAGSSGMRYRAFVPYSILGTGLWSTLHLLIGYFASQSLDEVAEIAGRGAFLLGLVIVVTVAAVQTVRFLRKAENRTRVVRWMEEHSATRPLLALGRRFQPQARFVWARLTPGGAFGLEVTTLLAVISVGVFVVIGYGVTVGADPGPTTGDMTAFDVGKSLRAEWLTDVAKLLTDLGGLTVIVPLGAVCAVALAAGRRWLEVSVLLVGLAIVVFVPLELKALTDRPRPVNGLTDAGRSAFPSGHAAHSMLYLWLALTVVFRLRPGMVRGGALVGAAIAVALIVGLSRVYLRVHFLSDTLAGWALGAAAFALCTLVALVAARLRENEARLRQNATR